MLATQVQYWTLQENIRHNKESENLGYLTLNETVRHNIFTEQETKRHNISQENYWSNSLEETSRHNRATEEFQSQQIEIDRMNAYTNQVNAATNRMNALTNIANAETQRNKVLFDYEIGSRNAATNEYNAATNRYNAQVNYNLGMRANDIAAENAATNSRNADTAWLQYTESLKKSSSTKRSVDVDETNVLLGYERLGVEQQKANVSQSTLDLQREQFKWKKITDIGDYLQKSVQNANNIFSNVLKLVGNGGY